MNKEYIYKPIPLSSNILFSMYFQSLSSGTLSHFVLSLFAHFDQVFLEINDIDTTTVALARTVNAWSCAGGGGRDGKAGGEDTSQDSFSLHSFSFHSVSLLLYLG